MTNSPLKQINSFKGEYRFLSNYWPVEVEFDGEIYPSVEQAYKSAKTHNLETRKAIRQMQPNKKGMGEIMDALILESGVRDDWTDELRLQIMENLLNQKFDGRDPELRQRLIDTAGLELIEGNDWDDTFFGVCNGIGQNHLGKLLMKIRESIYSVT